jgi:hypothetical protein
MEASIRLWFQREKNTRLKGRTPLSTITWILISNRVAPKDIQPARAICQRDAVRVLFA